MDSYDDEFTGENINCVALATTGDTTGKGEDNLIHLGKSIDLSNIFLVPYSIWNSRSLVGWSVSPSVRPSIPPWCRHLPLRCRHRCRHPHWVSTPSLCRCRHQCQHQHFSGISVLSTYSYHPFISTTIYPKILSNLSCYMELLNLSGFIY